jgi:hypothetical protein
MHKPDIISFSQIGNSSLGYISVADCSKNIPFEVKRIYWTYYTPDKVERGNHAHKELQQVIIAVAGVIKFELESNEGTVYKFTLDSPNKGLFIPKQFWRKINFSHNAVLLCIASLEYDENDYIRDYLEFKKK